MSGGPRSAVVVGGGGSTIQKRIIRRQQRGQLVALSRGLFAGETMELERQSSGEREERRSRRRTYRDSATKEGEKS